MMDSVFAFSRHTFFSGLSDVQMIYLPAGVRHLEQGKHTSKDDEFIFFSIKHLMMIADAFNGLSMVGHLKLAHLDLQSLNRNVFRGLRHVQVSFQG